MGAFLIRGMSLRTILAQYMARKTGATRGKDGNMHMGDLKLQPDSPSSACWATTCRSRRAIGLSFKMRGQDRVALCFFGDGATSRGDWHEGINMAAVFKVPVVFICNNNQYAYSTPLERQMAVENVADRAEAYGLPGEIVDGNDILAVWDAATRAIERARAGNGPTLIECKTFRMTGHSAHDDAGYVPPELFEFWEETRSDSKVRTISHAARPRISIRNRRHAEAHQPGNRRSHSDRREGSLPRTRRLSERRLL